MECCDWLVLQTQEASDIKHGAEEIILGQLRQVSVVVL